MYVGAHLPLDVLGGAALGWAAGALVHLVIGAPESRPPVGRVREALRAHGIEVRELLPVQPQAQRSTCLVSGDSPGPGVFVKVVAREWRDTDLLYRTWRRLRHAGRPARELPVHEAEHEALMGRLARAAGARVPKVLLVTSLANGAGLLVQERIDGRTLAGLGSDRINDDLLADLRRQVAALHRGGLVHQDLSGDNVMIDRHGMTWLVDFDQAVAGADRGHTADDDQALDATLADLAGPAAANARRAPPRTDPGETPAREP
jgi:undecaprenyl-diphosphatase